ncbi:MAG: lytic transglycosylase domain-containing protein [Acidobacteria bacterium]|nr:lytic transglycosylase domain-containing protein [Acidobacteriota bacterium]MBI3662754.1 lytic transglycosylase domain-containing protein [Acidobacteriota bacterium]
MSGMHNRRLAKLSLLIPAALAFVFVTPGALAETAVLRNGQRLRITGYERDGALVLLHVVGGRVAIRTEELTAIQPEDYFPLRASEAPADTPYGDLIRSAAQKHGVDEDLISSVIAAESDFNPRAISRKRARGLMQLMPGTAASLDVADAFDPAQNVDAGTRYLKSLLEQYGQDLTLALAAYNAGPDRVAQYRGVPPFPETQAYIRRVLQQYSQRKKK